MVHLVTLAFSSMALLLVLSWLPRTNAVLQSNLNINKPALRSIKSPDGDTIDCVDIYDQPALKDPLLVNHTIQMKPDVHMLRALAAGSRDKIRKRSKVQGSVTQSWQLSGSCPKGTIPIRRTKEDEISRASFFGLEPHGFSPSVSKYHREGVLNDHKTNNSKVKYATDIEYSVGLVEGEKYYGGKAIMNPWNPRVKRSEYSASQIWLGAGSSTDSVIGVGWHVFPALYGNGDTRLFIYTSFNQSQYCFNLLCTGFIQTSHKVALGGAMRPVSHRGAPNQHEWDLTIWKTPRDGRWWLEVGHQWLGYWPSSIFKDGGLADTATQILFGGQIANFGKHGKNKKKTHTTTQMGSGAFSQQGYGKASYFRNVRVVPETKTPLGGYWPVDANFSATLVTNPSCYDLLAANDSANKTDWGTYFYYGGPGKNSKCP